VNAVTIFKFTPHQDSMAFDVGDDSAYTVIRASDVPCSVQPGETTLVYDQNTSRTSSVTPYTVYFAANPEVVQRDRLIWVDDEGTTRTLIASGPSSNQAGRSAVWAVKAEEVL
jgi:hypothetical protein